jgi:DNA-binding winged helix-turn-helix (wHTH) protein/TolB-like protein/Tfp pilus assembly protein PilF
MSLGKSPEILLNLSGCEMDSEKIHSYGFKSFRLDVEERRLFHDGVPVALEPKVFDFLAALVERHGHLVEKEELLQRVWADTFVEEANITRTVYTLRKILGEERGGEKFIETVPKKGYRFVAEVKEISELIAEKNENGKTGLTGSNEDFPETVVAEKNSENKLQIPRTVIDKPLAPPAVNPKHQKHFILLAIVFLSAAALTLLLSLNFWSSFSDSRNQVKSIAILPLKPIKTANRDEIYEIGISDSLIHRFSSMKGLVVRPLSATRKYAGIEQDPLAAGREQKVDYVLASNYQLANGRIRVTAQVFDVASGQVEETYKIEKDAGDVFEMEDAIASELGNKLLELFAITSSSSSRTIKRGTTNEEAYRLYLHGRNLTERLSPEDTRRAIECFEQAIRLDPNFANAYSGMARAYTVSGAKGGGLPRTENEKAKNTLRKVFELDNNLAEAYAVSGNLKVYCDWDLAGAEKDFLRAIELEPNNDLARGLYAESLAYRGRFEEALAEIETALAINPNALAYQRDRGRILYYARRYDEAVAQLKRLAELNENFLPAWGYLWLSSDLKGDDAGAYEAFMEWQKRSKPDRVEIYQKTYESSGYQGVKRKLLEFDKLTEHTPGSNLFDMARQCALLGDKEQAFEYLNRAFEKHQMQMVMLNAEPALDSLRDDPRFAELVRRVGLN